MYIKRERERERALEKEIFQRKKRHEMREKKERGERGNDSLVKPRVKMITLSAAFQEVSE